MVKRDAFGLSLIIFLWVLLGVVHYAVITYQLELLGLQLEQLI